MSAPAAADTPSKPRLERTFYSFRLGAAPYRYLHILYSVPDPSTPALKVFTAYITSKYTTRSVQRMRALKMTNFVLTWYDEDRATTAQATRGLALFEFGEVDEADTNTPRMIHFNVELRKKMFVHAVKAVAGKWSLDSPNVEGAGEPTVQAMQCMPTVELIMA